MKTQQRHTGYEVGKLISFQASLYVFQRNFCKMFNFEVFAYLFKVREDDPPQIKI